MENITTRSQTDPLRYNTAETTVLKKKKTNTQQT